MYSQAFLSRQRRSWASTGLSKSRSSDAPILREGSDRCGGNSDQLLRMSMLGGTHEVLAPVTCSDVKKNLSLLLMGRSRALGRVGWGVQPGGVLDLLLSLLSLLVIAMGWEIEYRAASNQSYLYGNDRVGAGS